MTTINSGDSQTITGTQTLEAPLNVAGELNVTGELNIDTKPGISGVITDSSNNPIENATVSLFLQDDGTASEETTTDVNGAYSFSEHPDATGNVQTWHVVASYDDGADKFFSRSKFGVKASLDLGFDKEVFGDGSDGNVSPVTGTQTSEVLFAENYTIGSGVTRNVEGTLIVHARDTIQIDGTLEAVSTLPGGDGGPTTSGNGIPGDDGPSGVYIAGNGAGGSRGGGDADPGNFAGGGGGGGQGAFNGGDPGGDGGDGGGATGTIPSETTTGTVGGDALLSTRSGWDELFTLPSNAGAGGGGGGSGGEDEGGQRDGQFGGDGGRGGGIIILVAPNITGTGTVSTAGEDGQGGKESSSVGQGGDQPGAGGGGGGGSGGLLYTVSPNEVNESLTLSVAGGLGGIGGEADSNGHTGGDGANGRDGELYNVVSQ